MNKLDKVNALLSSILKEEGGSLASLGTIPSPRASYKSKKKKANDKSGKSKQTSY